ncbi:MAG: hypothetical protein FWF46_04800 [Oscillospiraceae bacterium]|nr:hypothetical protein [Oscillospiraceae bacterium]
MEKIIAGYPITLITKEKMAEYVQRAIQSEAFKNTVINEKSIVDAKIRYTELSEYLINYATATGDLSNEGILKVIENLNESQKTPETISHNMYSRNEKQEKFEKYLMPIIVQKWSDKLGIKDTNTLINMIKIQKAIGLQSKNNRFYTHSFNSALLQNIDANGLNINDEMFVDEYKSLSMLNGNDSPFKTGQLFYCEMSQITFGYAIGSPERLRMGLGEYNVKQQNSETPQEYYKRCLQYKLEHPKTQLTDKQKVKILTDVEKMIDFYYGQNRSSIAIWKADEGETTSIDVESSLSRHFSGIKSDQYLLFSKDAELTAWYDNVMESLKNKDAGTINRMQNFIDMFNQKYPENRYMQDFLKNSSAKIISDKCLNNFMYEGSGDGYVVESGIMERDKFAVATFSNPKDLYAEHQKALEQDLNILNNKDYDYTRIDKIVLPGMGYNEGSTEAYVVYYKGNNIAILNKFGEEMAKGKRIKDRKLQHSNGKIKGTGPNGEIVGMHSLRDVGVAKTGDMYSELSEEQILNLLQNKKYIGMPREEARKQIINSSKQFLLYYDIEKDAAGLARADDTFAFVGEPETIFNERGKGTYNSMMPTPERGNYSMRTQTAGMAGQTGPVDREDFVQAVGREVNSREVENEQVK